jgi:hypothetical protein
MPEPKLQLARLRDIGWTHWDPIGLSDGSGAWPDGWADEYDTYLIHAAGQLRREVSSQSMIDYLIFIESEYMALGVRSTSRDRAENTVRAISSDPDLWS